jgi:hypothetical protein
MGDRILVSPGGPDYCCPDPGSPIPGLSQMTSKDTYERISIDIVAAAKATFAKGRRTEAIEIQGVRQ